MSLTLTDVVPNFYATLYNNIKYYIYNKYSMFPYTKNAQVSLV